MKGLKKSVAILSLFFAVLVQPCLAYAEQSYTITESELRAIERNNEEQKKALQDLTEQMQIQSESLRKSEKENALIKKIGVPAVCIITACAFCGGVYTGVQIK